MDAKLPFDFQHLKQQAESKRKFIAFQANQAFLLLHNIIRKMRPVRF